MPDKMRNKKYRFVSNSNISAEWCPIRSVIVRAFDQSLDDPERELDLFNHKFDQF